jgi:RHS repeat-associated protein
MGPYGDNFTETLSTLDFTGFAGGFWDSENNGEHFGAREYENTHGSWLSPDPAGMAAVDISNPQSWNRYAYVLDNPVSFIDPTGLACWPFERVMFGSCAGFMNNGVYFGAGWNEFYVANIPVVPYGTTTQVGPDGQLQVWQESPYADPGCSPGAYCTGVQGHWLSMEDSVSSDLSDWLQLPQAPTTPAAIGLRPSPRPLPHVSMGVCLTAALIGHSIPNDGVGAVTTAINVAFVAKLRSSLAAAYLPGPGWLYAAVATVWDAGIVGASYMECKE